MRLLACLFLASSLCAAPKGGKAAHGTVAIREEGASLIIEASDKAIIDWSRFSIAKDELVQFIQPDRMAAVLNRDLSGTRSEILGRLFSNGKVILVNKAGIFIGDQAVLDTASFIGSTFDLFNDDFIRGEDLHFIPGEGEIVNLGTIQALDGEAVLIGRHVVQDGSIQAQSVGISAGCDVVIQSPRCEKIFIRSPESVKGDKGVYELAIQQRGKIEAVSSVEKNGRVFLVADQGKIEVEGFVIAHEGEIGIEAPIVEVKGVIDASGEQGGKIMLLGKQGCGLSGKLNADGFNGGFIEVSSYGALNLQGEVSAAGKGGKSGEFLIDPVDITISSAADSNTVFGAGIYMAMACPPPSAVINNATLVGILNGGTSVTVQTTPAGCAETGIIKVQDDVLWNSVANLTLQADDTIFCGAQVVNDGTGNVSLIANNDIFVGNKANLTPATQVSMVGSFAGTTTLTATNGRIVVGDNPAMFQSQVGYGLSTLDVVTGNIVVTAHTDVTVVGGSLAVGATFAQIGHGYTDPLVAPPTETNGLQGDITVTSETSDVNILGGADDFSFALIGHGGLNQNNKMVDVDGDITVSAPQGKVNLQAGLAIGSGFSFSQIGYSGTDTGLLANNARRTIGSITVLGGTGVDLLGANGLENFAHIGHGGAAYQLNNDVIGDISVTATTGDIRLIAGDLGIGDFAMIGHGGGAVFMQANLASDVVVTAQQGNILLQGGVDTDVNDFSNFAQIGHGGTDGSSFVIGAGWVGNTTVTASGSIRMEAGNEKGNYTQIGIGGFRSAPGFVTGNITVTAGDFISMTGPAGGVDQGEACYSQIGHGGTNTTPGKFGAMPPESGVIQGHITVTAQKAITLDGGGAGTNIMNNDINCPVQIGHGGAKLKWGINLMTGTLAGDINVTSNTSDIILIGGKINGDGGAWIGHGEAESEGNPTTIFDGNVNVIAPAGKITLDGGEAVATEAWAVIGNGLFREFVNSVYNGNQNVIASTSIDITAGAGSDCQAAISAVSGNQVVRSVTNSITLQGGVAADNQAVIFSKGTTQLVEAPGGSIFIFGGDGLGGHAQVVAFQSQTLSAKNDILARGGTGANQSFAVVANELTTGTTSIVSLSENVIFQNGNAVTHPAMIHSHTIPQNFTGASISIKAAKDVNLCVDLSTTPGPTSSIYIQGDANNDGLGTFAVDSSTHNNAGVVLIPSASGIELSSSGGSITVKSSDKYASGVFSDFMIGDINDLSLAPLMPVTLTSTSGNITVDPYRDILLTSGVNGGVSTGGSILLVADRNIVMSGNTAQISGGQDVTLVVDNYFPTAPLLGTGSFSKTAANTITAGQLRIFTSQQVLNSFPGTLNGAVFVPGTLYVNTNQERWGVYYFNPFFGGAGFTIFYKDFVPGPLVYESQLAVSQLFFDLDQYDDRLFWLKFLISYNREKYLAQKGVRVDLSKWTSYFQLYQKSMFWSWLFKEMPALDSLSSFEVGLNCEYIMPPVWKGLIR